MPIVTLYSSLREKIDDWREYNGDYEIIVVSVGMWYSVESLDMLNDTFGDPDSDAHMPWIVGTGQTDSVLKSDVIHSGVNSSEVELLMVHIALKRKLTTQQKRSRVLISAKG